MKRKPCKEQQQKERHDKEIEILKIAALVLGIVRELIALLRDAID